MSAEPVSQASATGTVESGRVSGFDRLRAARQAVDDVLTGPVRAAGEWGEDVLEALEELDAAFRRHRDVSERPGGTLEEAERAKPGLGAAVRRQRKEHTEILAGLVRVQEDIDDALETGTLDPEKVRWQAGAVENAIGRHIGRGSDLLHEAFFRDEGGEG
jgi:hypothetical protein